MKKKKVQGLIFARKNFRHRGKVKSWLRDNGYKTLKYKKQPIEKEKNTYTVRIREPHRFKKTTFRIMNLDVGVKSRNGFLK